MLSENDLGNVFIIIFLNLFMNKREEFNKILKDIKSIKIQGARNVAKAGLKAYFLFPNSQTRNKIISLRPTEPMLHYVLDLAESGENKNKILSHFTNSQEKINRHVFNLIKNNEIIFTHCHSTNVSNSLVYAHNHGKKFQVYNTETRPLFQGRRTAKELTKAGIKVTMFVDSAISMALGKENNKKKIYADKVLIGADALLKNGIINKIGSNLVAEISKVHKIPLYIVADSWKFTKNNISIEQRNLNEVWDKAPKNIKIKNPAFEYVDKKYISGIITEFGLMKYNDFVKKMKN